MNVMIVTQKNTPTGCTRMGNNKHMKAFPYVREIKSPKDGFKAYVAEDGMDLRDYFAAKAMQAIINNSDKKSISIEEVDLWVGSYAYTVADAMMKARIINE